MKPTIPKILIGNVCLALVFGVWGNTVFAESGETYGTFGKNKTVNAFSIGNSNAGGRVYATGKGYATHRGLTATELAQGKIVAEAKFLGQSVAVMSADATSTGSSTGSSTSWTLRGCVMVMGKNVSCPVGYITNGKKDVSSGNQTYSKTFFDRSARFTIGPVPARVSGNVSGYVSGAAVGRSYRYNGSTSSYDKGYTFSSVWAGLTGTVTGSVGLKFLAEVGATLKVHIVDASVSSNDKIIRHHFSKNSAASRFKYLASIKSSADYSLGSGYLKLWARLLGIKYTNTVASWGGVSGDRTLFDEGISEYFAYASSQTNPPPANCGVVYSYGVTADNMNTAMPAFMNFCGACGFLTPMYNYSSNTYKLQCSG